MGGVLLVAIVVWGRDVLGVGEGDRWSLDVNLGLVFEAFLFLFFILFCWLFWDE